MNIMVRFNKEMFKNIAERCENFNKIILTKDNTQIKELTYDNIENKNVLIEFIDDKEDIKNSTFLLHINNEIFTTNNMYLMQNDGFIHIRIFDFYSYLYEEIYNYIYNTYNTIPFEC